MESARTGTKSAKDRSLSALTRGLPLMTLGQRIPAKLLERGIFWLNRSAQAAQARAFSALTPLGIDPRHFAVMTLLGQDGALSQRQIAQSLNIDPAMMVALVDDLERLELVKREEKEDDRRAYAVRLTSKGAQTLEEAEKQVDLIEEDLFGPLSEQEYVTLLGLLRKLHADRCACGCAAAARPETTTTKEDTK